MLNQTVLVGRLVRNPETEELESGKKVSNITIAVPRNYKNSEGEYETDFIDCTLWQGIAENTAEYCKKGDIIGIKGRLEIRDNKLTLVAEKVTFLSNQKLKSKDDDFEKEDYEENIRI